MKPICIVDECPNPNCSQGMCFKHYRRWQRYGVTELPTKPTICQVTGCGKKYRAKGYCEYHYDRWIRTGSPDAPEPRPDQCTVDGCGGRVAGWGLCDTHYRSFRKATTEDTCSIPGCDSPVRTRTWCEKHYKRWYEKGSELWEPTQTYTSLHLRMRKARGPARAHLCVDCGAQANEWSYDHLDPTERWDDDKGGRFPYSLDYLSHYQPRCMSCHRTLDNNFYPRLPSTR